MMKHYLLLIMAVATITVAAQNNKWAQDMLEAKHKMLVEQVELTEAQENAFMPLYEEMEKEIYQTNRSARQLAAAVAKKGSAATEDEYQQAAEALSNAKVTEGQIEAKYFARFSKILSKKQLFLLKQTENNFTRAILQNRPSK